MKIGQSYWSKPNLVSKSENKFMGGWSNSVFLYELGLPLAPISINRNK